MSTARLELVVTSSGIQSADKDLKQLTATSKETEKQQQHMASVFAEIAAAETRASAKAVAEAAKKADAIEKAAQKAAAAAEQQAAKAATIAERESARQAKQIARENEQWNDAVQKAIARNERRAASAEKAAKREEEVWNNAIQRAKAGLDGVLPIRPRLEAMLQGVQQQLSTKNEPRNEIIAGGKEGAISALGLGALAGGTAAIAAEAVKSLYEGVRNLTSAVIEDAIADDKLIARLGGLTNSADEAGEVFADLEKQTLGKLPSTVDEVANAFIQLGNNGLQNGQSALKAYSNIAAQTGASLGTVTSAVQAATQGNYKALREFGVKVKEEGGDLQVTFRGQTETIATNAASIEAYMQSLGNVQFAGAVERQMDTIGGTVKKTHDAWDRFINTVGDSSLGSLIQSSIGASIGVIDMMTASVEALFDKVHKGTRELEVDKARMAEQDKLDKTMMAWADPTASNAELTAVAEDIQKNRNRETDKLLAHYTRIAAQLDKFEAVGETMVGDMTIAEARKENESNYRRMAGEAKTKPAPVEYVLRKSDQEAEMRYDDILSSENERAYRAAVQSIDRTTDSEKAAYEERKQALERYVDVELALNHHVSQSQRDEVDAALTANENKWNTYLDNVAAKQAKVQLDLQKRLQNIGIGPQTQTQAIERKYAGQYTELEGALSENLSGKNGNELKLQAEELYKEKSIAIEQARADEIARINRDLVQQSMQNAELVFSGLATAMKNGHGEMSAEYRTMFAMQKAFGIASAEIAMFQSMAEAGKQPFPANIPLYIKAAEQGTQIIAKMSSLSYSGAYDSGGSIPAGSFGMVGERRPELLMSPTLVRGPATVVGGQATADMLSSRQSQPQNLRIVNAFDGGETVKGYLGSTDGEHVLVNFVRRNGPLIRSMVR